MYTVLRFTSNSKGTLDDLGKSLNAIRPGIYDGPDKVVDRFSVSISKMDDWMKHQKDALKFLKRISGVLKKAASKRVVLECDVAVDPEDIQKVNTLKSMTFLPDFLERLRQNKIG